MEPNLTRAREFVTCVCVPSVCYSACPCVETIAERGFRAWIGADREETRRNAPRFRPIVSVFRDAREPFRPVRQNDTSDRPTCRDRVAAFPRRPVSASAVTSTVATAVHVMVCRAEDGRTSTIITGTVPEQQPQSSAAGAR